MKILIITSRAVFFQDVHRICTDLAPHARVEHLSLDEWRIGGFGRAETRTILVADSCGFESISFVPNSASAAIPFALVGHVCQNMPLNSPVWECVSRQDLLLHVQETSQMQTPEPRIREEVLIDSTHLRVTEFRLPTRCCLIPGMRDRLLRSIREFQLAESTLENHFCMALEEALANAFYHGNLELDSALKEDGSSRFSELAAEREHVSPYCNREIIITETVGIFGLWIAIQDQGRGFNVRSAMERCSDPEALLASGRGLLMMQAFSDELFFSERGNEVTLVLYARGDNRELPVSTRKTRKQGSRLVLS